MNPLKKINLWTSFVIILFFSSCKDRLENENEGTSPLNIQYPILFGAPTTIPNDNPLTEQGVDLGRHLFYDNLLSKDTTKSCASCHQQKNAFSDSEQFSEGVREQRTSRNSMSISNMAWQHDFFWDGRSKTLEAQALLPIQNASEMDMNLEDLVERLKNSDLYVGKFKCAFPQENISANTIAKALSQFERTLISSNSRYDLFKLGLIQGTASEIRGEKLFYSHPFPEDNIRGGNCGDCHSGLLTYSSNFSNNGLDSVFTDIGLENFSNDRDDRGKFKIPSLRNIELTAPYMHDGRFTTLEEVLDHYNDHIVSSSTLDLQITNASNNIAPNHTSLGLTDEEKEDIISFLKMLTDNDFINEEQFSDPFIE